MQEHQHITHERVSSGDKQMGSWKFVKVAAVLGAMLALFVWFSSGSLPETNSSAETKTPTGARDISADYVGSDACKDCHEDQFKDYLHTAHAKLTTMGSWKDKVTGCESCHGPGKAH